MHAKSLYSCLILCDPIDCRPLGSSVHGSLQARILGWVAIPFSRGSSRPRDQTRVSCTADRFFTVRTTGKTKTLNLLKYFKLLKFKIKQILWSLFIFKKDFLIWAIYLIYHVFIYLFACFWLCRVFTVSAGFSPAEATGAPLQSWFSGLSCSARAVGHRWASAVVAPRL